MQVLAAYECNQGKVRTNNEDNYFFNGRIAGEKHRNQKSFLQMKRIIHKAVLFSVFDGMGGEEHGEIASGIAAKCMRQRMKKTCSGIPSDFFKGLCHEMNEAIYQKSLELQADRIGTTMAAVYLQYDRAWICNVGDSRIYRMRDGLLERLSHDHTNMEFLESRHLSNTKSGLTQYLGMDSAKYYLNPYIDDVRIRSGDHFILCSDGLTDMVGEEEIRRIIEQSTSAEDCAGKLVDRALENGGKDNVTVIVCRIR